MLQLGIKIAGAGMLNGHQAKPDKRCEKRGLSRCAKIMVSATSPS